MSYNIISMVKAYLEGFKDGAGYTKNINVVELLEKIEQFEAAEQELMAKQYGADK